MAEYISKEFMLKNLEADKMNNAEHCDPVTVQIMERFIRYVSEFPAADVQPVKHGEWRKKFLSDTICCSECKVTWSSSFKDMLNGFNYCPNCGARMIKDGEQND